LLADYTNVVRRVVLANIEIWRAIGNRTVPAHQLADYPSTTGSPRQPHAWWLDSCLLLYDMGQAAIKKVDVPNSRFQLDTGWGDSEGLPLDPSTLFLLQQPYWGASNPALVAFTQNTLNQAIIACALERFRLLRGNYPETLQELLPDYLTDIPKDVVRGLPMLYENPGGLGFVLRSVGPNQTDDRSKPVSDDWLWSFPTNAPVTTVR